MADEPAAAPAAPTAPTAPPPEAAQVATPQSDPTPAQVESKGLLKGLDADIDGLWSKLDGLKADKQPAPEPAPQPVAEEATPPPPIQDGRTRDDKGRFIKADAPPEQPAPDAAPAEPAAEQPRTADPDAIERQVRERIENEQKLTREAEERVRAEQQFRQTYEAYIGQESDYTAVSAALRANLRGDASLLETLDVLLPNGKRVTEVTGGRRGLNPQEAASLLDTWDQNRAYEDVMGTRKVQQILSYWDSQTQAALNDPDVDAAGVRQHRSPGEQMKAAIESTRTKVEARKDAEYKPQLAERDKTIAEQAERINSLLNERGNLTSQQRAAQAATPDRPGAPGAVPRDLPTPDQLRDMSPEEAFKSGAIDRLLQALPGGVTPMRRRTG